MDGEGYLMPIEGWPCHTKMASVDESTERHETGKEKRKEGGSNGSQAVWQITATLTVMKNNQKPVH